MAEAGELKIKVSVGTTEAMEELRKLQEVLNPILNRRLYRKLFYRPVPKRFSLSDV